MGVNEQSKGAKHDHRGTQSNFSNPYLVQQYPQRNLNKRIAVKIAGGKNSKLFTSHTELLP